MNALSDNKIVSTSLDDLGIIDISPKLDENKQINVTSATSDNSVDYSKVTNTAGKTTGSDVASKTLNWNNVKELKSDNYKKDVSGWGLFDLFAEFANLKVRGATLSTTMTLGNDTTQEPGVLTLNYYPSKGDTKIQAGKTDYGDTTNGFIMGYDDSDGGKVKFELGDAMYYFKWTGSALDIKTDNAIIGGTSEFYGKLAQTVVQQTNTDEKETLQILEGAYEEDILRADNTIIDRTINLPGTADSILLTDFAMYGKELTSDIVFEIEYSMSTAETGHQVKLVAEYNVVNNSESIKSAAFTGTVSEEFTVNNTADTKGRIIGSTLQIPATDISANTELIQIRLKRVVTGLTGTNHGGEFRIHRLRIYQEVIV